MEIQIDEKEFKMFLTWYKNDPLENDLARVRIMEKRARTNPDLGYYRAFTNHMGGDLEPFRQRAKEMREEELAAY